VAKPAKELVATYKRALGEAIRAAKAAERLFIFARSASHRKQTAEAIEEALQAKKGLDLTSEYVDEVERIIT